MEKWQILVIAGVAFAILEIFTTNFVLLPIGIALLITAAAAPFIPGWTGVVALLAFNLIVVFAIFQQVVWPRLRKKAPATAASGMIGKIAVVSEAIVPATGAGYVKLYGDSWQAVSDQPFEVGARVLIIATEGNKVVVAVTKENGS